MRRQCQLLKISDGLAWGGLLSFIKTQYTNGLMASARAAWNNPCGSKTCEFSVISSKDAHIAIIRNGQNTAFLVFDAEQSPY
jgi:hypothetical protein